MRKVHLIIALSILCIGQGPHVLNAQDKPAIDSLLVELQKSNKDTNKVNILNELCLKYSDFKPDSGMEYCWQANSLAKKLGYKKGIANGLNNLGLIYSNQGAYEKSLESHEHALNLRIQLMDSIGIGMSLNNIGSVHYYQGNYNEAIDYYLQSLKIDEATGNKNGVAVTLGNIASIYGMNGNLEKSMTYFRQALKIQEEQQNEPGIATCLGNIALVHYYMGNGEEAIATYRKALKRYEALGDRQGVALTLNNMGLLRKAEGNYTKAIKLYLKALEISKEMGNQKAIAGNLNNIGELYRLQENYKVAIDYVNNSLEIARKIGSKDDVKQAYINLSKTYYEKKDYQAAYDHFELYSSMKDSIVNEENNRQIAELETLYQSEKKQKEIALLKKNREIQDLRLVQQDTELKKKKTLVYAFSGGFCMVLMLAFVIFKGYRQKQKANRLLEFRNEEIMVQKEIIEEKNKDITDSIEYAKTLQQAILPAPEMIESTFPDHFIYFKPKDIVSGDFYWYHSNGSQTFIAVADCTGHGVPGAFVSMIGNNLLHQIIIEKDTIDPGQILTQLNKGVTAAFKKEGAISKSNDGMDIALCVIDRQSGNLNFSGALRPLIICRNNEVIEVAGNRMPIGGRTNATFDFTTTTVEVRQKDVLYMFSDGYCDQFGGEKGKKFKYGPFKELLLSVSSHDMGRQKAVLDETFEAWKGDMNQLDDICVIGMRF